MGTYGLSNEEQDANILRYNHALFDNMAQFMELVWEIDLARKTLYIMHEGVDLKMQGRLMGLDHAIREFAEGCVSADRRDQFKAIFSADGLSHFESQTVFQFLLTNKDESHIWRFVITPVYSVDGDDTEERRVYVSAHDIQSEVSDENRRLRETNAYLTRNLSEQEQFRLATLSDAIVLYNINLTRGLIEDEFYEIVEGKRYPMLELVGMKAPCEFDAFAQRWCHEKVAPESRKAFLEKYNTRYLLDQYEHGVSLVEMEFDMALGRGIVITLRNTAHIFVDSESGDVLATISGRDVTKQRADEVASRETLRHTTEELRDMVALLTEQFVKVLMVNIEDNSFKEMRVEDADRGVRAGYSSDIREWLVNYCENGNVHPDDRECYLEFAKLDGLREDFLAGEVSCGVEYRRVIDGNFRWARMEIVKGMNFTASEPVVVLYVSDIHRDRTQTDALKLAIEHANQASAAKTEFLSSMSHDIRTPMNAIIGLTAIAKAHLGDDERVADCLEKISVSSNHLLGLINGVLDMNKIESGQMVLAARPFDLIELTCSVAQMMQPLVAEHGHALTLDTSGIVHPCVVGDAQRLKQVFTNMLSNAVKYTPDGGQISVTAHELVSRLDGHGFYRFIFKDNGMGIDASFISRIFDPFTRAQDSRIDTTQGTGLGLPISSSIIHMMGGDINVSSELGKGSTFVVTFYLELQDAGMEGDMRCIYESKAEQTAKHEEKANELAELDQNRFAGCRALLVEDNEINAEIICEIMYILGLEVDRAENGQVAVDTMNAAADGYYDIIFMDVQMPVMNGYEATRAIRASEREYLRTVPIVAVTANAFSDDIADAHAAGMNDHVAKPLNFELLQGVLAKYVS